jgi:hypothetical protein
MGSSELILGSTALPIASNVDVTFAPPLDDADSTPKADAAQAFAFNAHPDIPNHHLSGSNTSWWDYVGWVSAAAASVPASEAVSQGELVVQSVTSGPTSQGQPITPEAQIASTPSQTSDGTDSKPSTGASDDAHGNTVSSETQKGQGSAWYTPWSWYPPTMPAGVANPHTTVTGISDSGGLPTVDSELVNKPAFADANVHRSLTLNPTEPTEESSNLIQSTILSNTSGWASFFSSKSLVVKAVNGADQVERDEHGVEIMNLEGDGGSTGATPLSSSLERTTILSKLVKTKERQGESLTATPAIRSKSPSPAKEDQAQIRSSSPAKAASTNFLKKEGIKVEKRPASPAPSKNGTTTPSTPKPPSPPNMVLPTWADIFHTPPRSIIPPSQPSALTKTLRFVSDVLFAKQEDSLKGKSKDNERERKRRFAHFGKELPRAWDVVGERGIPDALQGCKRAVVIGIHGWFPGTSDCCRSAIAPFCLRVMDQAPSFGAFLERFASFPPLLSSSSCSSFLPPSRQELAPSL